MKIGIIRKKGEPVLAAVYGGSWVSVPEALGALGERKISELSDFIRTWESRIPALNDRIRKLFESGKAAAFSYPLEGSEFMPPFPANPKIFTGRGNSAVFVRAKLVAVCRQPVLEQRYNFNYTGHNHTMTLPENYREGGWNYEMVMVIGKTAKEVRKEDAEDYIFGYTSMLDMSVRCEDDPFNQGNIWSMPEKDKVFPDYAYEGCFNGNVSCTMPLGPVIVTKDEAGDPYDQILTERESGMLVSHGKTDAVLFTFHEMIEYVSSFMTLDPGDMIDSASITYDGYPFRPQYQDGEYIEGGTTHVDRVRLYLNDQRKKEAE